MDMDNFTNLLKTLAIHAQEQTNPTAMYVGEVLSTHPLEIKIEEKIILQREQLILARQVTDFSTEITVDHITEDTYLACCGVHHNHRYTGKKTFFHHQALQKGEQVLLMRMIGGQTFMVLDRIEG